MQNYRYSGDQRERNEQYMMHPQLFEELACQSRQTTGAEPGDVRAGDCLYFADKRHSDLAAALAVAGFGRPSQ
jgi:hypothetical protein